MDPLILRFAPLAPERTMLPQRVRAGAAVQPGSASAGASTAGAAPAAPHVDAEGERRKLAESLSEAFEQTHRQRMAREREDARRQGYAAGLAQAREELESRAQAARIADEESVIMAIKALEVAHAQALAALERSVGEIAFAALCRIAGRLAAEETFVLGIVRTACDQLRDESIAAVRLHPTDIARLGSAATDLLAKGRPPLTLIPDETIEAGGCIVVSDLGDLDATLATQLGQLRALLVPQPGGVAIHHASDR